MSRPSGWLKFKGHVVFVSEVLAGESVSLVEVADGLWEVHFYARLLGRLSERDYRLSG